MSETPLGHIKVIDFSQMASAPYCAKLLADFGADVIKIEPPEGDAARQLSIKPDEVQAEEFSPLFLYANTNKRGITLDLNLEEDRVAFRKLVSTADVLIEDRKPGEMAAWGLAYDDLQAINPNLIMTSITPFGQDGPMADHKAYHLNMFHASGQGYLLPMNSTSLDRAPVRGAGFLGDFDAGVTAAIATLAALFARGEGSTGQHIDVSKQHACMHLDKSQLRRYIDDGVSPDRTGRGRLLDTIVQAKDGEYIVIILSSQIQWKGLFEAMGEPEWGANAPFNTQAGRSDHHDELFVRLQEWASHYTADELFHKIQGARSACAPINKAEAFYKSPQTEARDYLVDIDHPVAGSLRYPGRPWPFSNEPWQGKTPAPTLGQHNATILNRTEQKQ